MAVGRESRRRPGADSPWRPPRWQVGPGPPAPPPPCVSSRQTLRSRRSGAPRSAGAGLPGLGHEEEPQVPPEEAGRPAPRRPAAAAAVSAVGSWPVRAPRAPGAALPRTTRARLCSAPSVSRWVARRLLLRLRSGLRVGPETPGDPPRRCLQGSPVPFPHPSPLESPSPWPLGSNRSLFLKSVFRVCPPPQPFSGDPSPCPLPADPTPRALSPGPALLGTGAPRPRACGSGGKNSTPQSRWAWQWTRRRLRTRTFRGETLLGWVDAVCWPLSRGHWDSESTRRSLISE